MINTFSRQEGWIAGPHGLALGATWYRPIRAAGPAVLFVRSFGHDDDAGGHGLHHVARQLAAAGHPVLTVHLSGNGHSAGSRDKDAPVRWIAEVRSVAERFGRLAPGGLIVGGHRAGALVALHALAGTDLAAGFLAWHLPESGRRFVRELRILQAAQRTLDAGDVDGLVIGAHRYSSGFIEALARLGSPPAPSGSARVLRIERATSTAAPAETIAAWGEQCVVVREATDWIVSGTDDRVVQPVDAANAARRFLASFPAVQWPAAARDAFVDCGLPSWAEAGVHEEVRSFGDVSLTGVLTRPADAAIDGTGLVLLSARGPGDSFVELARTQATRGRAVLRYDLSGFGLNEPRAGHVPGEIYSAAGRVDVAEGVAELHRQGVANVIVVGFCAGGWAALRGRYLLPPAAIVAINVELFARNRRWMRRAASPRPLTRWVNRMGDAWRKVLTRVDPVPPARGWIRRLTSSGTRVRLVYDTNDSGYLHYRRRVAGSLAPALAAGEVTVTTFAALGHLTEGPDGPAMLTHVAAVVDDLAASSPTDQRLPVDLA